MIMRAVLRIVVVLALIGLLVLLPGCTVTKYVDRPVRVEIPIPVPCDAEMPEAPDYATEGLTGESSDGDIIRALLVEREQRGVVERSLRAELAGCVTSDF